MSPVRRAHRNVLSFVMASVSLAFTQSCAGSPTGGADPLQPESFELSLVDGQSLPAFAYSLPFGGAVYIASARIKSTVAGRAIDPRIFENRSGQGSSGGSSRDSTTAAALVADIRVFYEGDKTGKLGMHTDTSNATIERRGDLLIITRDRPIARLVAVDTAQFIDGKLVVTAHEWERFSTKANAQFLYTITK